MLLGRLNLLVSGPTRRGGHTLDFVFRHDLNIEIDLFVCDRKFILFGLSCNLDSLPTRHMSCTPIRNESVVEKFSLRSSLCNLVVMFDQSMRFDAYIRMLTRSCFLH